MIDLRLGDCLDVLAGLEAESVDTVITDPSYGLGKEPDALAMLAAWLKDEQYKHNGGGFMGKEWDSFVPGPRYWRAIMRVLKPGGMTLAFGGTRTFYLTTLAMRIAGFEIRDTLCWLYGQGFNKVGQWQNNKAFKRLGIAEDWTGYAGSLKPAWEPIILAMKPRIGTFANNALEYGVAGIWVDGCRIGTADDMNPNDFDDTRRTAPKFSGTYNGGKDGQYRARTGAVPNGRWPANLVLSHTPECRRVGVRRVQSNGRKNKAAHNTDSSGYNGKWGQQEPRTWELADPDGYETCEAWECAEDCPVFLLDQSSGERSTYPGTYQNNGTPGMYGAARKRGDVTSNGDTGGASRFFYTSKASRSEREAGLLGRIPCIKCGGMDTETHIDPKTGREVKCIRNGHPTVKPLELCRWLARLTKTPTGGVVLDPFMGSGSILVAAVQEGRDVIGIEMERASFDVATVRIEQTRAEMVQARMIV